MLLVVLNHFCYFIRFCFVDLQLISAHYEENADSFTEEIKQLDSLRQVRAILDPMAISLACVVIYLYMV